MASGSGDRHPASSGDASVHGGGQSAESGIACRSSSTTQDRERLFRDTISRLSHAMHILDTSLSSSPTLPNREKVIEMRHELFRMIQIVESYNPFDDMSIETFYSSLSRSVTGTVKYRQIDTEVSTRMVKTMFPSYIECRRVRGYSATKCTDPVVAPLMYPRWLATHHRWPQKDEFPLYFCKQLYAEFYLHYDVDYTDFPGHVGQGQGRLSERFRPADTPAPVNKRAMVGPNLLVMPRGPQMVSAGQSVPDASIRTDMFSSIATVVT